MTRMSSIPARQQGAALVIGLVLLAILTLLAVSGLNASSMELVMAGNEQYRQKASQAAETGVEDALTQAATFKQICTTTPTELMDKDVPEVAGDGYRVTVQYRGEAEAPGDTVNEYQAYHYQVVSSGRSVRNANSEITQGLYVVQRSDDTFTAPCP
jgi:type IV pilus assembly protein PilX